MKTTLVAAALGAALLALPLGALAASRAGASGLAVPRVTPQTVNWQIPLTPRNGLVRVTGTAQYQAQPGQRELQVEIEHLRALAGRSLLVRVDGVGVGSAKVSRRGIAQLTRNSERGQTVPVVAHGSVVTVSTGAGVVLVSGTF